MPCSLLTSSIADQLVPDSVKDLISKQNKVFLLNAVTVNRTLGVYVAYMGLPKGP